MGVWGPRNDPSVLGSLRLSPNVCKVLQGKSIEACGLWASQSYLNCMGVFQSEGSRSLEHLDC